MEEKFKVDHPVRGPQENQPVPDQPIKHEAIEIFGIEKLTNFVRSLGIKWKIVVTYKGGMHGAAMLTDPSNKTHEILLSTNIMHNIKDNLPDIAHELCHARFSEELDPIYSALLFQGHYGKLEPNSQESKNFTRKKNMLETCQSWVDIWINELRNNLWPELTVQDSDRFMEGLSRLQQTGNLLRYWDDTHTLVLAMILAEQKIYKGREYAIGFLMKALGNEWRKVKKLRDLFEKLPRFTNGGLQFTEQAKMNGLVEFERVVREVAKIFNYPIRPTIKKELVPSGERVNVWDFE